MQLSRSKSRDTALLVPGSSSPMPPADAARDLPQGALFMRGLLFGSLMAVPLWVVVLALLMWLV
jgi:hypothetical protein